ncbi:PREDICTED: ATP-binding cassette sub-family C member Sur [Drosophila arizonae]|uniref:ATP-binding cassette sub-family C member Sur n=1 Tax=Drosophila arizonae TaxID=7263 RepID=A0ABM1NP93_DROAR|nr:PREDICTED: ATP-binding cassette sub-family C member Sur [Drosophila arizonae]
MGPVFNLIRCDQLFNSSRDTYDNLKTDICGIDRVKYILTCLCICVLFLGCIYVWKKCDRCHKTLLAFHNLRAAVSLLLLAVNSLELARSLLPQRRTEQLYQLFDSTPKELNVLIIIGTGTVRNALAAVLLTIMLMCYHRVLERKKMTDFLYGSIAIEMLIFLLRIDELAEVAYYEELLELETCLLSVTVICLLVLAALDGYTIYKEIQRFRNKNCTISYVPQVPWLLNDTIRENILFGESFRPKRYDFVLDACALKPDIELMPTGDFTIIGERGINLSGGQRQRVAVARAIYSSANVVIMDDPLSSLDNEVGSHVFEQCVRQMLLKSNRTIILVTQQLQLIKEADYLIVMKDGRLQACGTYKDIELKQPQIIAKWNSIIAKANENAKDQQQNATERTARERWKLFKNVSKLGLQRSISINSETGGGNNSELDSSCLDGSVSMSFNNMLNDAVAEDDEDDDLPASLSLASGISCGLQSAGSFPLQRKRASVYGSRHLIYDVPLPIDECQADDVIMRPRRRSTLQRRGSSARSRNSWHRLSGLSSATVTSTSSTNSGDLLRRSLMTASCSSYAESSLDGGDSIADGVTTPPLVAELSPRAQSWQPAQQTHHAPVTRNVSSPPAMEAAATLPGTEAAVAPSRGSFQQFLRRMSMRRSNKPKHHHRPLSAANSIRSISEESSAAALLPTVELSSVPSTPVADISNPQPTTNLEATLDDLEFRREMHELSAAPPPAPPAAAKVETPPVKHVKIDFNALPTNGRNNSNNNNNNDDNEAGNEDDGDVADVPDVTSLSMQLKSKERQRERTRAEARAAHAAGAGAVAETATAATAPDVERKYGQISNHIYLLYMRASGLPIIIVFFITALIWQCLRVYTDVWLQHWSDHVDGGRSDSDMDAASHEVTYYFRMYATISCVCIIMAMISTPAGQWAGCKASRNLHDKLLLTILHKTLHFFQVTPLGRILNRFSTDMAIIDKKIAATCQRLLQFSLLCLCAILINVSITPWFLALTLPICGAYYAIQKFYRCSARELQRIENSSSSPVISHLAETIQGVTTIRAYNQQARFTEILFKRLEANTIAFTILNTSNRWLGISLDYLGGCIVFVAIVTALATASVSCSRYVREAEAELASGRTPEMAGTYAINKGASSKELTPTPSLVGLAINYTLLVPIYLNWVVKLLADMEMYAGSVERIAHYAQQTQQEEQEQQEQEQHEQQQQEQQDTEISNEVDRSHCTTNVDKVYPGATSAGVDVAGDSARAADKLNAGNAEGAAAAAGGAGSGNHLSFHTAPVVDKRQLATTAARTSMINDKALTALGDKVALSNEPSRRIKTYQSVPISWPQRGDISFEDVSLRYEGQRQNVISHLNLKIPAGQRVSTINIVKAKKASNSTAIRIQFMGTRRADTL